MARKFVLNDGNIYCANVELHRDICKDNSKTVGGGYWHFNQITNTIYLYGKSEEFGFITKNQLDSAYFHYRDGGRNVKVVFTNKESLAEALAIEYF